jgi:hypothetical protein
MVSYRLGVNSVRSFTRNTPLDTKTDVYLVRNSRNEISPENGNGLRAGSPCRFTPSVSYGQIGRDQSLLQPLLLLQVHA